MKQLLTTASLVLLETSINDMGLDAGLDAYENDQKWCEALIRYLVTFLGGPHVIFLDSVFVLWNSIWDSKDASQ
jgi:hypothetical protein